MRIYNTYTNKIEKFVPIEENKVKMYVCGPTVYNYIHIGNTRPIVVFDVLARFLKSKNYDVIYVQNFTDIDDKIINKANENNTTVEDISNKYIAAFLEDVSKLNLTNGIIRPKVTDNIEPIKQMIRQLLNDNYAYISGNDIIFDVSKFSNYGKLSNQKLDELKSGIRIDIDDKKKSPLDFVLWKGKKEGEPYYNFEFSDGRPGWHIECSSMIKQYLGDNIDIHAGGKDLIFPHHENEIAQSVCSTKEKSNFVNYWLHNGYITVNKEKMSKSLGNFMLLRDILKEYDGNVIRLFILTSHYRKDMDFSNLELDNAKKTLENISKNILRFKSDKTSINTNLEELIDEFKTKFDNSLSDDLNTPMALSEIFTYIKKVNKIYNEIDNFNLAYDVFKYSLEEILGIKIIENNSSNEQLISLIKEIRNKLREQKNYQLADEIRDKLKELGIDINDRKI